MNENSDSITKSEYHLLGFILLIFSFFSLLCYLTIRDSIILASFAAGFGIGCLIFTCLAGEISKNNAIISATMLIIGGFIIPLLPIEENCVAPLVIISFVAAVLLAPTYIKKKAPPVQS
jgi:hypothetical protein